MGQIDDHPPGYHLADNPMAEIAQPAAAAAFAMQAAAKLVVEEMRLAQQAETGAVKHLEVADLPLQRMRPFRAQDGADRLRAVLPRLQQGLQILGRADQHELVGRALGGAAQGGGLDQRALLEAEPARQRAQLADEERGDVVRRLGRVATIVLAARALGDGGEDLHRDIALGQPGDVGMAAPGTPQQVAVPEQRIRMPVADHQPLVQRLGLGRDRPALGGPGNRVQAALDESRPPDRHHDGGQGRQAQKPKDGASDHADHAVPFFGFPAA